MARGCARIDSRPDTAKIGSAERVEVHHARLLAVIGVRKTFPHGLDPQRSSDFPKYTSFVQPYRLPSVGSGPIHCRKMILGGGHAATRVHRVYWRRGSM